MTAPSPLAGLPLLQHLPDISGRRVLVRADFNTPLETDADGLLTVADDFRIRMALPTIEWLLERGAEVTVCSHLGRPDGAPDSRWSMEPVRNRLDVLCPGVDLMENLRFSPGERANDPGFLDQLVSGFDAYVNEAFGVAHRTHASIVGPPSRLPAAAGRLLAREVEVIGGIMAAPVRPFVAVVGGAKVADKLGALESLAARCDVLAVGGAMAFTFLSAMGHEVGDSPVDLSQIESCRKLLRSDVTILLPTDIVALEPGGKAGPATGEPGPRGDTKILSRDVPDGWQGFDIGPETASTFADVISSAGTVVWNGPLGFVEDERFLAGTAQVAHAVAECPGFTMVGGGDSARVLDDLTLCGSIDFLSTGGGASLAFIKSGDLPALVALRGSSNAPVHPADATDDATADPAAGLRS